MNKYSLTSKYLFFFSYLFIGLLILFMLITVGGCSKDKKKKANITLQIEQHTLAEKTHSTIEIKLDKQPSSNVVISITSSQPNKLSTNINTLLFTNKNWNVKQSIKITALYDDDNKDSQVTVTVSVKKELSDNDYHNVKDKVINLLIKDLFSLQGKKIGVLKAKGKPVVGIHYSMGDLKGITNNKGEFEYYDNGNLKQKEKQVLIFSIENYKVASTLKGQPIIKLEDIETTQSQLPANDITALLYASDPNQGLGETLQAPAYYKTLETSYFKLYHSILPLPFEKPSLGMNLSAPQAEADGIHLAMIFVDIFRTSRPFRELSNQGISYDAHGWPTFIPNGKEAITWMLEGANEQSVPFGRYSVYYDGDGDLAYSGIARKIESRSDNGEADIIELNPQSVHAYSRLILKITRTNPSNPIKNIRIVMSGGICVGNPYNRVETSSHCPMGSYQSFASQLKANRNKIIFNPDYLNFMRHFSTLRMMNIMEATPRVPGSNALNPCPKEMGNDEYEACLLKERSWNQRAQMDDATWGGSYRTIVTKRYGVPLEVTVALANLLKIHPWYTLPFNVTNDYVDHFARYVKNNLDSELRPHIEYTNEYWNNYWGSKYVELKGKKAGLNEPNYPFRNDAYTAKIRYYTKRSLEIFALWEAVFGEEKYRLYRILGSYTMSTSYTNHALEYNDAASKVDAIAIAPYFYGCWSRTSNSRCANTDTVHAVFDEANTVDDIFNVLNNTYDDRISNVEDKGDPYSLSSIIQQIKKHAEITNRHGIDLIAYEGGQHLVTYRDPIKDPNGTKRDKIQALYEQANLDPRMGQKYQELLNAWKKAGGKLFTLFSSPQSHSIHGMFGIKTELNVKRSDSSKFDAIFRFEEAVNTCWWAGC